MPPKIAKLVGLGAFGAIGGMLLIYALIVWISFPTKTTGIDWTLAAVTWISCGVVVLALIAAHVVLARELLRIGGGEGARRV